MKIRDIHDAFGLPDEAFNLRVARQLSALKREDETMRIRRMRLSLIAAVALCVILATAAAATIGGIRIADIFRRDDIPGNKEIVEKLSEVVQLPAAQSRGQYVEVTLSEALLTDNYITLVWTVKNISDQDVWIGTPSYMTVNGQYPDGTGYVYNHYEYMLKPGEQIEASRGNAYLTMEVGDSAEISVLLTVYVGREWITEDTDERLLEELEQITLSFPLQKTVLPSVSALKDGQPLTFEFQNYTLRVTRADRNETGLIIEYERIYDTKEAALADKCAGKELPYWFYKVTGINGEMICTTGGGGIPEEPVQLGDGTWAWRLSLRYSQLLALVPDIVMTPYVFDGQSSTEYPDERVTLTFGE